MKALTPPIVLSDGTTFGSLDELVGYFCLPTDVVDTPEAYDAAGRRITLTARSDDEPITLSFAEDDRPEELHELLRRLRAMRPAWFGAVDPGAGPEDLLKSLWRAQHREPFPSDIR